VVKASTSLSRDAAKPKLCLNCINDIALENRHGDPESQRMSTDLSAGDCLGAKLRGFGPLGILAIVVILAGAFFPPLGAILALVWVWLSRTPWREIGYVRPQSWTRTLIVGIVFGIAFKFLMKAVVMPLLGAPPINQAYHFLAGNTAALPGMLFVLIVNAGFGEETFFRGWMFERLGKLFGPGVCAKIFIVLITSVLFSAAHYPTQGFPGAEQAIVTGLAFGTIFAVTGRIVMLMIAHAAFDLTALAMIYWDFETTVAHSIFK
jgi:membrane protease YdiL (CAAX protease family)